MSIKVRDAMLIMNLDPDGMAQLLGISRSKVIEFCLTEALVPARLERKVLMLMGPFRLPASEAPVIMETIEDCLYYLANRGGSATFHDVNNEYGLTLPQLKNIEFVEAWVTCVWEERSHRYGVYPAVYLTAAGYVKIGKVMPAEASTPSSKAVPMVQKQHLNAEMRVLLEAIEMQMHKMYRSLDDLKTMRMLVVAQVTTVDLIMQTYGHLLAPDLLQPQLANDDEEEPENED